MSRSTLVTGGLVIACLSSGWHLAFADVQLMSPPGGSQPSPPAKPLPTSRPLATSAALAEIAAHIEKTPEFKGKRLGVGLFTISQGSLTELASCIAASLEVSIVQVAARAAFDLVPRTQLCAVMRENKLWVDDRLDPSLYRKLATFTGVDFVIIGTLTVFEESVQMNVLALNTDAARAGWARTTTLALDTNTKLLSLRKIEGNGCGAIPTAPSPPSFVVIPKQRTGSENSADLVDTPNLPAGLNLGNYYALIIANQAYRHLKRLETPARDAQTLAETLRKEYGFRNTQLLLDANGNTIVRALDDLRRSLTDRDNLLIYYAGHGYLDKEADRGYWMPVDAEIDSTANWLSNADITDKVRAFRAKHVLVVSDSCYSGSLVRTVTVQPLAPQMSSDWPKSARGPF